MTQSTIAAMRRYQCNIAMQRALRSHKAALRLIDILYAQTEFERNPPQSWPRTGTHPLAVTPFASRVI